MTDFAIFILKAYIGKSTILLLLHIIIFLIICSRILPPNSTYIIPLWSLIYSLHIIKHNNAFQISMFSCGTWLFSNTQMWMFGSPCRRFDLRSKWRISIRRLGPHQRFCHRLFQQGHRECVQPSDAGELYHVHLQHRQHSASPGCWVNLFRFNVFSFCLPPSTAWLCTALWSTMYNIVFLFRFFI